MISRFISLFLSLLLLIATCGYFPLFKIKQRSIRRSVKMEIAQGLPGEELHCIRVTPDNRGDINWERKGKEFRYQNRMYDIVRVERFTDTTYYYCISDQQESRLLSCFEDRMQQQTGMGHFGKQLLQKMMALLLSLYFPTAIPPLPELFLFFPSVHTQTAFVCLPGFGKEIMHPPGDRTY